MRVCACVCVCVCLCKREEKSVDVMLEDTGTQEIPHTNTYQKVLSTLSPLVSIDGAVERYKHRIRDPWALSGSLPQGCIFENSTWPFQ